MKESWDWEESDIELLIRNGVQESLTLDYKGSEALVNSDRCKKELSKDVSAFANSAGGVIVYGVSEEGHLPRKIDDGCDPKVIEREWIEQVINSNIQRRIDGIRIKQIELKSRNNGRVIYVVSIPQSNNAPHMAKDKIFYKRFNYQSVAMEEYEVRDVSRRLETPNLSMQFLPENIAIELEFDEGSELSKPYKLNAIVTNESASPAMYYIIKLSIDTRIEVAQGSSFNRAGNVEVLTMGLQSFNMSPFIKNFNIPTFMPIWKGVGFMIFDSDFSLYIPKFDAIYPLSWSIDSLGMRTKSKVNYLIISNGKATITSPIYEVNTIGI